MQIFSDLDANNEGLLNIEQAAAATAEALGPMYLKKGLELNHSFSSIFIDFHEFTFVFHRFS